MTNTARETYIEALTESGLIERPTPKQMLRVCPHLDGGLALNCLVNGGKLALPPLKVRGAYRCADYYNIEGFPPMFFGGSRSQRVSTHNTAMSRADYPGVLAASEYADDHWPEALLEDTWVDYMEVYIQDPAELDDTGTQLTKFVIAVGLSKPWRQVTNLPVREAVQYWDEAIAVASIDALESAELRGDRPRAVEYNCARCGGGLSFRACTACATAFRGNNGPLRGWNVPLPPKLIELLHDNGHVFDALAASELV